MDAALHADFGGSPVPGLGDAAADLVEVEVVGPAAQVLGEPALGEGAELAFEVADIGVVDVAVHHIGDNVAREPRADPVGRLGDGVEVIVAGLEQPHDSGFVEPRARFGIREDCRDIDARRAPPQDRFGRRQLARRPVVRPRQTL